MSLSETEFRSFVADTLKQLYLEIDDLETDDIDVTFTDGVVSCSFETGGTFVLSQQVPTRELWLSANFTAWHFRWDGSGWTERDSGAPMLPLLSKLFTEKLKMKVEFS